MSTIGVKCSDNYILPHYVERAIAMEGGNVYVLEDDPEIIPWAGKYGLNLPVLKTEEALDLPE